MMGEKGDLPPSAEYVRVLREGTDVGATSSVPATQISVLVALFRPTRGRIVRGSKPVGHDAHFIDADPTYTVYALGVTAGHTDQRTLVREAIPDKWEHRFTKVINAVNVLREWVRSSDRDRQKQHKEFIDMIHITQQDTACLEPLVAPTDTAQQNTTCLEPPIVLILDTTMPEGGSGSRIKSGPNAPQVLVPAVVISDTTVVVLEGTFGSKGPTDPSSQIG
ncbi:hypothetical protein Ddye_023917 [Dipteronia dyeriana]|uniref:Uncharacterized protein n=1 Tax=Dipteronia dyeriana TaxID=168575 RepID=A0AAD9TUU2_9ROSI|nr:hypothetical protein Ddye_023917 [Dipteronia dyeriana]